MVYGNGFLLFCFKIRNHTEIQESVSPHTF